MESSKQSIKRLNISAPPRKTVDLATQPLVHMEPYSSGRSFPLVIRPAVEGLDLVGWAAGNKNSIEELLKKHGALLFRDFRIEDASNFEKFIRATSRNWVEYREPATPRSQVSGNIYTSTEYPADQHIFLHNENSHCEGWPLKIFFYCLIAPGEAGETPIADCRRIYQRLDPAIRENFSRRKIKYVRNLGDGLGFSWQTVFKTSNRSEVEEYCRKADIGWEWKDENRLRVHYVRPAVIRHPDTGEMSWFNHGTFFHASTLDPKVRELLAKDFGADNLPYNTYYGDGAEIELSTMDALREVYYAETIAFPWQKRDLLMLDNIAAAHGRRPFQGHRKILVGMADEYRWDQASSINSQ